MNPGFVLVVVDVVLWFGPVSSIGDSSSSCN